MAHKIKYTLNHATREIHFKVVYYGPGLCGKTTNLQYIFENTKKEAKGKMISLATASERTLFFDFLPIYAGEINGYKTRFHLYTVPGQVFYDHSRKLILRDASAVVFVADSQVERMEANLESMDNLRSNLAEQGVSFDQVPWILQYNKRDMPNAASVEELRAALHKPGVLEFEANARSGEGVVETLKAVAKLILTEMRTSTEKAMPPKV